MITNPLIFEDWKDITDKSVQGVVDGYRISNFGRVYSNLSNKFLTPVQTWNGYYRVYLRHKDGSGRYHLIHRILMIEFHPIENYKKLQVNHKDCDKSYNEDQNLEWMTGSENIIHAYKNGAKIKEYGEDCSYSTITNEQAREIARLISTQQYSHKEISEITGCPKHIIHNISCGTTWKKVCEEYNLDKYKKGFILKLSDEELHKLCKYFEDHTDEYPVKANLFRSALYDLFNMEYTQSMSATLSRIYNHKTRSEITNKYNF